MAEVGARDRLVMAGLVVLGLLTVVAGVLSGRSTINYVLARDAREAVLSWAGKELGCDQVRGFYYGKPDADVPESEESIAKEPQVA